MGHGAGGVDKEAGRYTLPTADRDNTSVHDIPIHFPTAGKEEIACSHGKWLRIPIATTTNNQSKKQDATNTKLKSISRGQ